MMGWFLISRCYTSETMRDRAYRKSYMGFRLQQKLMTLNDFERQFTALSRDLYVF